MLLVAVGVYLVTRFWELVKFPIYFFCDEAIQTNLAAMLVRNGMRDDQGWWFPPFFLNAEKWNLGWSIYVHTIPTAVFGTTEYVTRGTSVLVSLLGAVAIALMLKLIYGQRMWWLGVLVLGVMPTWFLHSRTAFETVMMVSFYACFLLCYLLYRYRDPRFLYLAVVFGAMTFYSYANGQGVMVLSVALLAVSDVRYHFRNRWTVVAALLLGGFFILPYARFQARLPYAFGEQYQALNSYWVQRIPLSRQAMDLCTKLCAGAEFVVLVRPQYYRPAPPPLQGYGAYLAAISAVVPARPRHHDSALPIIGVSGARDRTACGAVLGCIGCDFNYAGVVVRRSGHDPDLPGSGATRHMGQAMGRVQASCARIDAGFERVWQLPALGCAGDGPDLVPRLRYRRDAIRCSTTV